MKLRLKGAKTGHSLLKKKSDALTLRFREVLKQIIKVRLAGSRGRWLRQTAADGQAALSRRRSAVGGIHFIHCTGSASWQSPAPARARAAHAGSCAVCVVSTGPAAGGEARSQSALHAARRELSGGLS